MKRAILDKKIHSFIARKEKQYPELHRSVDELTKELDEQERAHSLIHFEEDDDTSSGYYKASSALHYA